jgi:hypothetical protein
MSLKLSNAAQRKTVSANVMIPVHSQTSYPKAVFHFLSSRRTHVIQQWHLAMLFPSLNVWTESAFATKALCSTKFIDDVLRSPENLVTLVTPLKPLVTSSSTPNAGMCVFDYLVLSFKYHGKVKTGCSLSRPVSEVQRYSTQNYNFSEKQIFNLFNNQTKGAKTHS